MRRIAALAVAFAAGASAVADAGALDTQPVQSDIRIKATVTGRETPLTIGNSSGLGVDYDSNSNIGIINCRSAGAGDGGCVASGGRQSLSPELTFAADAGFSSYVNVGTELDVGVVNSLQSSNTGGQLILAGQLSDVGTAPSVLISAGTTRTHGYLLDIGNNGSVRDHFDPFGNITASIGGGGSISTPAFLDANGQSGHISLGCQGGPTGCYTSTQGGLVQWADNAQTVPYGGLHGEVSAFPLNPRDAGFIFSVNDTFWVDFRGATVQNSANLQALANFDKCGQRLVTVAGGDPVPGQHYMNEFDSAMRWAVDQHAYYVCEDTNGGVDAGNWGAVCTDTNGKCPSGQTFSKGSITLSGGGSGTATVPSGATCVCSDSSGNASVGCSQVSTTLTATGTAAHVIKYICL